MHPLSNLLPRPDIRIAALLIASLVLAGCVSASPPNKQPWLREQADFFMQAGITSHEKQNLVLAGEQFASAQGFYSRFDDYNGMTHALLNLAQVSLARGQYDLAQTQLDQARKLIDAHSLRSLQAYFDLQQSSAYLAAGKLSDAESILSAHDAELSAMALDDTQLALLLNKIRLVQLTGQDISSWINRLSQHENRNNEVNVRIQRFRGWQACLEAKPEMAASFYNRALNTYRDLANPGGLMATRLEWAQACERARDQVCMRMNYEQLLILSLANRHHANTRLSLTALENIYLQSGDTIRLQQLAEWRKQFDSQP